MKASKIAFTTNTTMSIVKYAIFKFLFLMSPLMFASFNPDMKTAASSKKHQSKIKTASKISMEEGIEE